MFVIHGHVHWGVRLAWHAIHLTMRQDKASLLQNATIALHCACMLARNVRNQDHTVAIVPGQRGRGMVMLLCMEQAGGGLGFMRTASQQTITMMLQVDASFRILNPKFALIIMQQSNLQTLKVVLGGIALVFVDFCCSSC